MSSSALTPFNIGQGSPANTFLAVWVAADAGLFEAHGLRMGIVPMVGGKQSADYFAGGRINLMHIGMSSVVRANAGGSDLVTIGSLSNVVRGDMFATPGVTSGEQLKGGIVGISSEGSETDTTTTLALRQIGLARSDVTMKEVGNDRLSPLRRGEITATTLGEPERSQAVSEGLVRLVDLFEAQIPWVYSGLVTSRSYLAANRAYVTAAMTAVIEGNELALNDADRAKRVLARELDITDDKILELSYANFKTATPAFAEASRAGAENILSVIEIPGISKSVDDYLDNSILDELRANGTLDAIHSKYAS